jgi:hypothetical protein
MKCLTKETFMQRFMLFLAFALFPGCMHLGMLGGSHSDSPHQTILEKETITSSLKTVALFPSLVKGDESRVVVKLTDRKSGQPVPKAHFSIRVVSMRDSENESHGGMMMMQHQMDTSQTHTMQMNHDIDIEIPVSESSEIGTYNAYFTPLQTGSYKFVVTMVSVEGYTLEDTIVIEGTRMVMPTESSHEGMHGDMGGSNSTWLIVGAAAMGAMMIVIMATR